MSSRLAWNTQQDPVSKKKKIARHQWLSPIILATLEAEIRRIMVRSQARQIVHETLSWKNPS
jgi:hypothetical protein